jgi:transcription elongation factor Elf1
MNCPECNIEMERHQDMVNAFVDENGKVYFCNKCGLQIEKLDEV